MQHDDIVGKFAAWAEESASRDSGAIRARAAADGARQRGEPTIDDLASAIYYESSSFGKRKRVSDSGLSDGAATHYANVRVPSDGGLPQVIKPSGGGESTITGVDGARDNHPDAEPTRVRAGSIHDSSLDAGGSYGASEGTSEAPMPRATDEILALGRRVEQLTSAIEKRGDVALARMLRSLTNHMFTIEGRMQAILEGYEKRLDEYSATLSKTEGMSKFSYAICCKPEIKKLAGFKERGGSKW